MAKKIPIEIDLDTRKAQQSAKALNKELQGTEGDLKDVESAGKMMARAISMQADDMISEIDATRLAVDKLEQALGPGFEGDTTAVVADLKRVGLTAQEIEADADELAAALKRIDGVSTHAVNSGFKSVDDALVSTRDEAARTHSTVANFVGNSVEEIPGISGALGPVVTGFGQLAEGAAEGEINVKQLVVAGAAFGGMAFVLGKIQGHFARIAEAKAWRKEQVQGYADALKDADSAAGAIADKLREAEELTFSLGQGLIEMDLLPQISKAGLGVEQFSELVAGGAETIDAWAKAQRDAGNDTEAVNAVVLAATQEHAFFAEAQEASAISAQFFGDATEGATDATEDNADAIDRMTEAAQRGTEQINEAIAAYKAAEEAQRGLQSASLAYRQQVADTAQAVYEGTLRQMDATLADAEREQAARDVEAATLAQAEAAQALAEDQAEANGEQLTANESTAAYVGELERLVGYLSGPAAVEIQAHINRLKGIPTSINTDVSVRRNSYGSGSSAGGGGTTANIYGATGGIVNRPTVAMIGEAGPEAVIPLNKSAGNGPLPSGLGGDTYNLTVNAGLGVNGPALGDELLDIIMNARRRNGKLPWE